VVKRVSCPGKTQAGAYKVVVCEAREDEFILKRVDAMNCFPDCMLTQESCGTLDF